MSTYRRDPLSRRTFLRGAGAALALPFLEAMVPGGKMLRAADPAAPLRLLAYYVPCGIHMPAWTPTAEGADYQLTEILAPLANVKADVNVLTGLENRPARPDGPGDHASGTGAFITAAHPFKTEGSNIRNGISMDQVAANAFEGATKFNSIQLGMDGGGSTGNCDSGYSCAYARNISWASEQTPLPKISDLRQAFDYIFGGFDPGASREAIERRRAYKKSVLDAVRGDTARLKGQLGAKDNQKLDEYLEGVRALEMKVEADQNGPACSPPTEPGANTNYAAKAQAMADLMVAAFECDLTRVTSFMLANAGSNRNYQSEPGVNVSGGHHQLSHHQNQQSNFDALTAIDIWEVRQFAYLLEGLKAKTDIDGNSLLHNSAIFFSSEISDGNRHNHDDMPILLAGAAGGRWSTGRHIRYEGKPPVGNLFIEMLNAVGVPITSFGLDGTQPLTGLT